MTTEANRNSRSYPAAGDLSADQAKFVKINSSGQVAVNTVAGGRVDGVLAHPAGAVGRAVTVDVGGKVKVLAGGTLAPGDLVQSSNAGKAIVATGTTYVVGKVVEGAANGGIASIELFPMGVNLALA
jgi:hypothetical protein